VENKGETIFENDIKCYIKEESFPTLFPYVQYS